MTDLISKGASRAARVVASAAQRQGDAYRGGEDRPLGGYLALLGTYAGAVGVGTGAKRETDMAKMCSSAAAPRGPRARAGKVIAASVREPSRGSTA